MRNAGPPQAGAANIETTTKQHLGLQDSGTVGQPEALIERAAAYGPCAGRSLWAYLVRCSRCGGAHLHRGGPPRPDGHLRTAPCGQTYVLVARTVLPAIGRAA